MVHQLLADAIDRFREVDGGKGKTELVETQSVEKNQLRLMKILAEFVADKHPGMKLVGVTEFTIDDIKRLSPSLQKVLSWGIWYRVCDATNYSNTQSDNHDRRELRQG